MNETKRAFEGLRTEHAHTASLLSETRETLTAERRQKTAFMNRLSNFTGPRKAFAAGWEEERARLDREFKLQVRRGNGALNLVKEYFADVSLENVVRLEKLIRSRIPKDDTRTQSALLRARDSATTLGIIEGYVKLGDTVAAFAR